MRQELGESWGEWGESGESETRVARELGRVGERGAIQDPTENCAPLLNQKATTRDAIIKVKLNI